MQKYRPALLERRKPADCAGPLRTAVRGGIPMWVFSDFPIYCVCSIAKPIRDMDMEKEQLAAGVAMEKVTKNAIEAAVAPADAAAAIVAAAHRLT